MSDLIERLRGPCPSIPAMRDAASEIERLTAVRFKLRLRAGMVIEASRWNANLPQPDLIAPLRQAARSCCLGDVSVLLVRLAHLVVGCLNRSHPRS